MTAVLVLTIPQSTMAVAWGLVAMTVVEFMVNFSATRGYTSLSWWQMMKSILPSLLLTFIMYVAVRVVGYYAESLSPILLLLVQTVTGVIVYVTGAYISRFEALNEFLQTIKSIFRR